MLSPEMVRLSLLSAFMLRPGTARRVALYPACMSTDNLCCDWGRGITGRCGLPVRPPLSRFFAAVCCASTAHAAAPRERTAA
jgi:hypothetical protein